MYTSQSLSGRTALGHAAHAAFLMLIVCAPALSQTLPPVAETADLSGPRFGLTLLSDGHRQNTRGAGHQSQALHFAIRVATGMTFRAGVVNVPVNVAVVPSKSGTRVTLVTGFSLRHH
jgi:hypothetical protein